MAGRVILQIEQGVKTIDLSYLTSGVYIMSYTQNGMEKQEKFIKQ